jgi:hypothetical protein
MMVQVPHDEVEPTVRDREVAGSNPVAPSLEYLLGSGRLGSGHVSS